MSNYNNDRENMYGSRITDAYNSKNINNLNNNTNYHSGSYINNIMPVNKKIGSELSGNLNNSSINLGKQGSKPEASFNQKNILPANSINNENIQDKTFLNSPNANRSFNGYKSVLDYERAGESNPNNPNISINIINHNYSHFYVHPEEENNARKEKIDKFNSGNNLSLNNNKYNEKYNPRDTNMRLTENMNYKSSNLQNYNTNANDMKEKHQKYSNINLFRSGHSNTTSNLTNYASTPNNPNNINLNKNNTMNNKDHQSFNRIASEKQTSFVRNSSNFNLINLDKNRNSINNQEALNIMQRSNINNFDKNLIKISNQNEITNEKNKNGDMKGVPYNQNNNLTRYNSFLADKYPSNYLNNNRPSSAAMVNNANPNHLSRYPMSTQQIQSLINNQNHQIPQNFNNINNINSFNHTSKNPQKTTINSNYVNNINYSALDRKKNQVRENTANPSSRMLNKPNYSMNNKNNINGYFNQNYYQTSNFNNNINLINNPQKQKFGNNLSSSINNFDMELAKNIGNNTSRPGTSLNEGKINMVRDFSVGTPKRTINNNLLSTNNNNSAVNSSQNFLNLKNNNKNPNNNYNLINRSINGLTAKDLVYEDYSNNIDILMKQKLGKNLNSNGISRSVEKNRFKPSTPNYHNGTSYFNLQQAQNRNNIISNQQKQNTFNNYNSIINNFPFEKSNIIFLIYYFIKYFNL